MIQYIKIQTTDGARFILRVTGTNARFVRGVEVDRGGDEVVPSGAHNRLRIVERGAIKREIPMRMSNTYGWLESGSDL